MVAASFYNFGKCLNLCLQLLVVFFEDVSDMVWSFQLCLQHRDPLVVKIRYVKFFLKFLPLDIADLIFVVDLLLFNLLKKLGSFLLRLFFRLFLFFFIKWVLLI